MADEGRTTEERVADVHAPAVISVDDYDLETGEEVKEEKEEKQQEEELEIEVEGKGAKVEKEESEVSILQKEINSLKDEILKLASRKPEKLDSKEDKKEKLTHAQLVNIIKENKDNPEVIANVIKYIAEDTASEIKNKTMEEVSHKQWASNLSGLASQIISSDEDGYLAANPKLKGELDEMSKNLGLSDHPVGKLAAYSIFRLMEGAKAIKEKGSQSDKAKTTSTTNQSRVMDKTRTSGQTGKVTLSPAQLAVAKKFGVKPETYAMFVKKS